MRRSIPQVFRRPGIRRSAEKTGKPATYHFGSRVARVSSFSARISSWTSHWMVPGLTGERCSYSADGTIKKRVSSYPAQPMKEQKSPAATSRFRTLAPSCVGNDAVALPASRQCEPGACHDFQLTDEASRNVRAPTGNTKKHTQRRSILNQRRRLPQEGSGGCEGSWVMGTSKFRAGCKHGAVECRGYSRTGIPPLQCGEKSSFL